MSENKKTTLPPNDFFMITASEVTKLGLKGTELIVYAIIQSYGCGEGFITCSIQYLMDWTGETQKKIESTIEKLISKKLIRRTGKAEITEDGLVEVQYQAIGFGDKGVCPYE